MNKARHRTPTAGSRFMLLGLRLHEQSDSQRKPLHKSIFTFIRQNVIIALDELLQALFSRLIQFLCKRLMVSVQILRQLTDLSGVHMPVAVGGEIAVPQ